MCMGVELSLDNTGMTLAVRLIPTWVLELHLFLSTCTASYNMVSAHQKGTEPSWMGDAQYTQPIVSYESQCWLLWEWQLPQQGWYA